MIRRQKQTGMTAIGWLIVVALIIMFVLVILKLFPIYMDGFKVGSILDDIENEPDISTMTPVAISKTILKRLDINMVSGVTKDDIYIDKLKNAVNVEIEYEIRERLVGNIDVVVHFNKSVTIPVP
ncbi:hypothetical protein MNBD_GAMMA25-2375 [hydrothermal vent metagenome]|uniref:DUF4845 domain-containing protein n=1 Tax=hydrothermal vent metagenome TaxID=652676 RepID=A0A3B1BSL1_9ZZZZ